MHILYLNHEAFLMNAKTNTIVQEVMLIQLQLKETRYHEGKHKKKGEGGG